MHYHFEVLYEQYCAQNASSQIQEHIQNQQVVGDFELLHATSDLHHLPR